MFSRSVSAWLLAGAVSVSPTALLAQAWPPPPPPAKNMDRLPTSPSQPAFPPAEEPTPAQAERAQEPQTPMPPAPAAKKADKEKAAKEKAEKDRADKEKKEKPATRQAVRHPEPSHEIACEGTFAKTSSQMRLEYVYKTQNVAYTQVDTANGNKVMATVLFPKDPKRRLEVWWSDEEKRRDIYLIVINGQSVWEVPRGVRLGLTLAALEKINHKPFRLKGLDKDGSSQVSDWNGGLLARLPGGCKVGVRLRPEAEVATEARQAVSGNKEFASNDADMRALKPVVAEIILGY